VTWTPYAPGFYDIHVKSNGQPIKDSLFNVKIVGEVRNSLNYYTISYFLEIEYLSNLSVLAV
jgi:hypothetical protein